MKTPSIEEFCKNDDDSTLFLGTIARDIELDPSETDNPFVFSDGTEFNDGNSIYDLTDGQPAYISNHQCIGVLLDRGQMYSLMCDAEGTALCFVDCPNSGSERFHAKLPFYGLLVAGSVFNAFHALAGLVF